MIQSSRKRPLIAVDIVNLLALVRGAYQHRARRVVVADDVEDPFDYPGVEVSDPRFGHEQIEPRMRHVPEAKRAQFRLLVVDSVQETKVGDVFRERKARDKTQLFQHQVKFLCQRKPPSI